MNLFGVGLGGREGVISDYFILVFGLEDPGTSGTIPVSGELRGKEAVFGRKLYDTTAGQGAALAQSSSLSEITNRPL